MFNNSKVIFFNNNQKDVEDLPEGVQYTVFKNIYITIPGPGPPGKLVNLRGPQHGLINVGSLKGGIIKQSEPKSGIRFKQENI